MIGDFGNFTPKKGLIPILKKKLLRGLKEERRRKCPAPSRIRSHNFINPLHARCRCATANEGRSAVREISRVSWSNRQKQMFSSMQPNSNMVSFLSLNSTIGIPRMHTQCSFLFAQIIFFFVNLRRRESSRTQTRYLEEKRPIVLTAILQPSSDHFQQKKSE